MDGTFLSNLRLKLSTAPVIIELVIEMVYICENCGYLFSRTNEGHQCPDCGKPQVRSASKAEIYQFISRIAELVHGRYAQDPRFPNLVETEISTLNCFAFTLPATALQIDSGMMTEIIVNYGLSSTDQSELTANVWAKRDDGVTVDFLMPLHLPAKENEPPREQVGRIFAALNMNDSFKTRLYDFISRQLEPGG